MKKFYDLLILSAILAGAVFVFFSIVLAFLSIAEANAPVPAIIEAKQTVLGLETLSLTGLTISLVSLASLVISFMTLGFLRERFQFNGGIEPKKAVVYAWLMTSLTAVLILMLTSQIAPQQEILWRFAGILGTIVGYSFGASALIGCSLFAKEEIAEQVRREEVTRRAREASDNLQ